MKCSIFIGLVMAQSVFCCCFTSAQTVIYNFDAGLGLANLTQSQGTAGVATVVGATDNGTANTSNLLRPLTVASPNATGVLDLTSFPSASDYSVTWKEYLTQSGVLFKKGLLLRGTGTGSYTTTIRQGYYFMVQNNVSGTVSFRILKSTSSGITDLATANGISIANSGVNQAVWYRASVNGNILTFSYSTNGINFTSAATYTDALNLYSSGTTQLVYGIGGGAGQYYYDDITFQPGQGLPVTLLAFSALPGDGGKVRLSWTTANETNSESFSVQRCTDGVNFSSIYSIPAAGNSGSLKTYNFEDDINSLNSARSSLYYRLYQKDINGSGSYSKVIPIKLSGKEGKFSILANPVQSDAALTFESPDNDHLSISIMDDGGRILSRRSWDVVPGQNATSCDVSSFPSGSYFIIVSGGTESSVIRLQKL